MQSDERKKSRSGWAFCKKKKRGGKKKKMVQYQLELMSGTKKGTRHKKNLGCSLKGKKGRKKEFIRPNQFGEEKVRHQRCGLEKVTKRDLP